MSAEATGWVFRCSPFTGATFACHLAIADSVNDQHDNEFFMAVGNLAKKARVTRKTAQGALRKLEKAGYLDLLERREFSSWRYRFCFPQVPDLYVVGGRRDYAPPAKSTASGGRRDYALTQRKNPKVGKGASHDGHFSPGAGVIKWFRSERDDETKDAS